MTVASIKLWFCIAMLKFPENRKHWYNICPLLSDYRDVVSFSGQQFPNITCPLFKTDFLEVLYPVVVKLLTPIGGFAF